MTKFIHAADFHLDSPFEGLGPAQAAKRRGELRDSVQRIFKLVESEGAELVFLSGDLFDNDSPYRGTVEFLKELFAASKARIFIAPGNHDYYTDASPYADGDWPRNVHIFKSRGFEKLSIPEYGCTVWGAAFTDSACFEPMLEKFIFSGTLKDVNIMVMHGDIQKDSKYNPVPLKLAMASGMDYIALGHIHACGEIKNAGETKVVWPGCHEGRGFDEQGSKGVILGEISNKDISYKFVPTCLRVYRSIEVDFAALDSFVSSLSEENEKDIFRITVTGRRGQDDGSIASARGELSRRLYSCELIDRTRLSESIWDEANTDTLKGLFLRRMRSRIESSAENSAQLELAVKYAMAAMENREPPGGYGK